MNPPAGGRFPPIDLRGRYVFLSASFPSGERGLQFAPANSDDVADAVVAVARSVLANGGRLAFGGHPTVSPLVLMIASELRPGLADHAREPVVIYQSRVFETQLTTATRQLAETGVGRIVWTDRLAGETPDRCPHSLRRMREQLFDDLKPICGFFIGGMEGIRDEWSLGAAMLPGFVAIPILTTGGAASELPVPDSWPSHLKRTVLESRRYPAVVHEVLTHVLRSL